MHDHHQSATGMNLLPLWVQVVGTLVLCAVTAAHAVHLLTMPPERAQVRGWHWTHLAMSFGMLWMFAPWAELPGEARAWQYTFGALTIVLGGWILSRFQRGEAVNLLWVPALIGMAAMAYMWMQHRGEGVYTITYLLVAYYALEAAAWAQGWFAERDGARSSALPFAIGPRGGTAAPLAGRCGPDVHISQAASALLMAYMFLAMDSGASEFFQKAFGTGAVTEHTIWAVSGAALILLACVPHPAKVREPARESLAA